MERPTAGTERPALERSLGSFGFFALAFGSIIGVGWVTAMGSWLDLAGPLGAILAFVVGGAVMLLIGLCYAEVTPMLPVAGGEVAYSYKAFGTFESFLVGWFLAFGYISVSAFEAISIGKVLSFMFPGTERWLLYDVAGDPVYLSHLLLAAVFTVAITAINYLGVRWAATFQSWMIAAFLIVTLVFVVAGIVGGSPANLEPLILSRGGLGVVGGVLAVFVTVPFWYVGFDTIPQGAEEAEASLPPRRLGLLILTAIVGGTLFYVVLILSVSLSGPWQTITAADLPTARAFEAAFQSRFWVQLVLTAALLGLFTSWNGFFLAGSRVIFSMGRGRIIAPGLGATHPRRRTPHRAILFTGLFTLLAPLLGRDALVAFVDAGSFCIGVAFLGVSLSVIRLRRKFPDAERPYRIPGGLVIPYLAMAGALFILAVMVIPGSPAALSWPREIIILGIVITVGGLFWVGGRGTRRSTSEADRAHLILERFAEPDREAQRRREGQ